MQPVSERPAEHFKATQPDTRLDLGRILRCKFSRKHTDMQRRDSDETLAKA
jgi:hypothetical protein